MPSSLESGARPRLSAPTTLVVMPEECQSMPMTAPNDWNQCLAEQVRDMTKTFIGSGRIALALALSLAACTNPYDPGQRAVGGGPDRCSGGRGNWAAGGGNPTLVVD